MLLRATHQAGIKPGSNFPFSTLPQTWGLRENSVRGSGEAADGGGPQRTKTPKAFLRELVEGSFPHWIAARVLGC